jgi:hypothetical protein
MFANNPERINKKLAGESAKAATLGANREAAQLRAGEALDVGSLVFRCPVTQAEIKSGIDLDFRTFRRIRQFRIQVCCGACMNVHAFNVEKGLLARYEQTELLQSSEAEVAKRFGKIAISVGGRFRGKSAPS